MAAQAGEVDLLVANAGVSEGHAQRPSWEIDADEWHGMPSWRYRRRGSSS